jgi:hypothetical protein
MRSKRKRVVLKCVSCGLPFEIRVSWRGDESSMKRGRDRCLKCNAVNEVVVRVYGSGRVKGSVVYGQPELPGLLRAVVDARVGQTE